MYDKVATVTSATNEDTGVAAPSVFSIHIPSPVFQGRAVTAYSEAAVIAVLKKWSISQVRYPSNRDGLLMRALDQSGISF